MLDSAGNLSSSRSRPSSSQGPSRPQTAKSIGTCPSFAQLENRIHQRPESAVKSRMTTKEGSLRTPAKLAPTSTSSAAATPMKERLSEFSDPKPCRTVVIHVMDEVREIQKDFRCDRDVLIKGMSYFAKYISDEPGNEVDISVHVDVTVFE